MELKTLQIKNLRNINSVNLSFHSKFNFFVGPNGSGKTSVLEAIYLMGLGRSFRSHINRRLVNDSQDSATVFGEFLIEDDDFKVGIEKTAAGKSNIRLNGENQSSAAGLARLFPLQLINPDAYRLLEDGPKYRRQYFDWGLFHVKHSFFDLWLRAQRVLKQRNSALRSQMSIDAITAWDREFIEVSEKLDEMRAEYFEVLKPVVNDLLSKLFEVSEFRMTYYSGWTKGENFGELLRANISKDRELGYTSMGPQRADIKFKVGKEPAVDILSRGQQKLLIIALSLAQGVLLREKENKNCIYLIDDLAAELDPERRQFVSTVLGDLEAQVFISAVEAAAVADFCEMHEYDHKLFHVKHGEVEGG